MTDPLEVEKKKFLNLKSSFLLRSLWAEGHSWAAKVHRDSDGAAGEDERRGGALRAAQAWPLRQVPCRSRALRFQQSALSSLSKGKTFPPPFKAAVKYT